MKEKFDIIIIGGGPGGYTASIRAAQLGFKVACIDNWKNINNEPALGGTCANVGCIPSKVLLQTSENYKNATHNFKKHGIKIKDLKIDFDTMLKRKNNIIKQINDGILYLFKKNKVNFFHGKGFFLKTKNEHIIKIHNYKKKEKILKADNIIIATGSKANKLNNLKFDEKKILSNIGALSNIDKKTKKICIIGAGIIGLEIGSIWNRLNLNITILEQSSFFLNTIDKEISNKAYEIFIKQGIKINLNTKIIKIQINKNNIFIKYFNKNNNIIEEYFDKLIISIGRKANTKNLNLKILNILTNKKGFIIVNNNFQTNIKNIWAIGDVIGGKMLAHKAQEEALKVIEHIYNKKNISKINLIPSVIYTSPEIAWIGKTEQQLIFKKIKYKKGIFPFYANAKAKILDNINGIIKILTNYKTKKIIGTHIIGPSASELIAIFATAIKLNATYKDIINICYAHPSLSEIAKEVAMSIKKKSINF